MKERKRKGLRDFAADKLLKRMGFERESHNRVKNVLCVCGKGVFEGRGALGGERREKRPLMKNEK